MLKFWWGFLPISVPTWHERGEKCLINEFSTRDCSGMSWFLKIYMCSVEDVWRVNWDRGLVMSLRPYRPLLNILPLGLKIATHNGDWTKSTSVWNVFILPWGMVEFSSIVVASAHSLFSYRFSLSHPSFCCWRLGYLYICTLNVFRIKIAAHWNFDTFLSL